MIGVVARVIIAIIIVTLILVAHFSPAFLNKYIYASQNGFNHHVPLKKHGRENSKKKMLFTMMVMVVNLPLTLPPPPS